MAGLATKETNRSVIDFINKIVFIGIAITILMACHDDKMEYSASNLTAHQLYEKANLMVEQNKYDSAIVFLKQAFEKGFEKPMQIVRDSNLYVLIDSPEFRSEIRLLLDTFASESQTMMIRDEEEGDPLVVKGKIVDEANGEPLKKVSIELVHTDHEGYYFKEKTKWNPRLFAYLVTDNNGEFRIQTIRPGRYKDDDGNDVPAHIHFTLKKEGFRIYASEFTFEDEPIFMANGNIDDVPVAKSLNDDIPNHYEVIIPMQKE